MLLVQFPREAVHEVVHPHCAHEAHPCPDETITANALEVEGHQYGTTHYESYCPLFQELLLAYAGILSVDALGIDNPKFVSAYATICVAPHQAQAIAATARGPPESC